MGAWENSWIEFWWEREWRYIGDLHYAKWDKVPPEFGSSYYPGMISSSGTCSNLLWPVVLRDIATVDILNAHLLIGYYILYRTGKNGTILIDYFSDNSAPRPHTHAASLPG